MILKHQTDVFWEDAWRWERWKFHREEKAKRVKIFISQIVREKFSSSVLSQLFSKRVETVVAVRENKKKVKIFCRICLGAECKVNEKKYFQTHNFLVKEKKRKKCWLRITCCSFLTHTQTAAWNSFRL